MGNSDYKTYRKLLTTIKKLKDNINQHNDLINKEGFCDSFEGEDPIHRIEGKASHDQLEGEVSRNQIEGKDSSDHFEKDSRDQTERDDTNENIEGEDTNENIEGEDTNENIEEEETYEYIEGEGAHENIEGEDTQNQVVIDEICSNCKRRQHNHLIEHYGRNSVYCMSFHQCSNNTIRRKKFKHSDIRINNEEIIYILYNECNEYLTTESNNNTESSCWPAFLIKVLKNTNIHSKYQDSIWKFIPTQMRYWWLDHVKEKFSVILNDVSIDYPSPYFRDITIELNQWNESMNSNNLSEIARICNKMLMPTILCPWGESVFPHKHGSVSIDLIFQRCL